MRLVRLLLPCALTTLAGSVALGQYAYWDQQWDGVSGARPATRVTNADAASVYHFEDFAATGAGVMINKLIAYGTEAPGNDPSLTTAYVFRLCFNSSFTNPGAVIAQGSATHAQAYADGVVSFVGLAIFLPPGFYKISMWAERPAAAGNWLWRTTTPVIGSQAVVHNPGGGLGFGTSPRPGSEVYGETRDMAFTIETPTVPEPSTIFVIAFGCTFIALRRRVRNVE